MGLTGLRFGIGWDGLRLGISFGIALGISFGIRLGGIGLGLGGIGFIGILLGDSFGAGRLGRCGIGRIGGDGRLDGGIISRFGTDGDGRLGDTLGDGRLGDTLGEGFAGDGKLWEGGCGISFGRLCIGDWDGGIFRRFSKVRIHFLSRMFTQYMV